MSRGHVYVKAGVRRAELLAGERFGTHLTEGTPNLDAPMQRGAAPSGRSSLPIHN